MKTKITAFLLLLSFALLIFSSCEKETELKKTYINGIYESETLSVTYLFDEGGSGLLYIYGSRFYIDYYIVENILFLTTMTDTPVSQSFAFSMGEGYIFIDGMKYIQTDELPEVSENQE